MKPSRKSKSVSWATGVDLCQVKLFLSEDSPSKVGQRSLDNLLPKASSLVHQNGLVHANWPPGFEFNHLVNQSEEEPFIPLVRWKNPANFFLPDNWLIAAGEESEDPKLQTQREATVLEAVYPRFSDIPPSPSVSWDVSEESHSDTLTPVVPIIPIEEEADLTSLCSKPMPIPSNLSVPMAPNNPSSPDPSIDSHGVNADVVTAASAALAVLMKTNEHGSLIDTNYLITILSDPSMIQKLIGNGGQVEQINSKGPTAIASSSPATPISSTNPASPAGSISILKPNKQSGNSHKRRTGSSPCLETIPTHQINRLSQTAPSPSVFADSNSSKMPISQKGTSGVMPNHQAFPPLNPISEPNTRTVGSAVKDINYYKNLVRQHGEQQHEWTDHINGRNGHPHNHRRDIKMVAKNQKSCMYFNTRKGCRNGAECPYLHEMAQKWHSGKLIEAPTAKRMRLSSDGITGMT